MANAETKTMQGVISTQIKAALMILKAVADTVRESGEVPAGTLYALMMDRMDLTTFEKMVAALTGSGLVERRGDLLVWVG